MAEKRGTQISRAREECLVYVIPAKKCIDGLDQIGDYVASFRLANNARILQILTDLYGNAIQISTDLATGDLVNPPGLKISQIMVVRGQASQTRLRNG
jgi:hypothetical protein